jgi:hypothetical protein
MSLRLQICRDVGGTWSVRGPSPVAVARLPSLSASLDYARRESAGAPATVELLIGGFYAVFHQEHGWRRPPVVRSAEGFRRPNPETGTDLCRIGYSDTFSVARSRSSSFIEWRAWLMRSIAALASGFVAMKRSKSALRSASSRQ